MAAAGDEKIGGLDVAMNDSLGVRGIERVGNFDGDIEQAVEFERAAVDHVLQCGAIEKFHGDERLAILFANIVDGANVRMVQRRGCLRFALEAPQGLRVAGDFVGKKFQSDETLQTSVLGLVNHAHATAAKIFHDAVMGEGLANQGRAISHEPAILVCRSVQVNDT